MSSRESVKDISSKAQSLINKFLFWRLKAISNRNFLIIVSELMDTKVETVQLTDHMAVVMEKFETQTAWNLVVLDIRKYAGIISKSDLIEHYRGMIKRSSNLF